MLNLVGISAHTARLLCVAMRLLWPNHVYFDFIGFLIHVNIGKETKINILGSMMQKLQDIM